MPHTLPFLNISHESCQYHFKLTNHGKRRQRLYWLTDDSLPSTKTRKVNFSGRTVLPPISAPRKKDISGRRSLFSVSPPRVELFPGCSVDMVLTGSSDSPRVRQFARDPKSEQNKSRNLYVHGQIFSIRLEACGSTCTLQMLLSSQVVQERLICRAIVGDQSSLEQIMSIDVTCLFMATMLSISPKQLNFFIKKVRVI